MTDEVRKYRYRVGDMFQAVLCRAWMNESGYGFHYYPAGQRRATIAAAKRDGFEAAESDDFNIWVLRSGRLAAVLWMNDVIDDEPDALTRIVAEAGFEDVVA